MPLWDTSNETGLRYNDNFIVDGVYLRSSVNCQYSVALQEFYGGDSGRSGGRCYSLTDVDIQVALVSWLGHHLHETV